MSSMAHNSFIIGGGKEKDLTDLRLGPVIAYRTVSRGIRAVPSLFLSLASPRTNGRNSQSYELWTKTN